MKNKLTIDDIIKALECCAVLGTDNCKDLQCPALPFCKKDIGFLDKVAREVILRQKAEIDRLRNINKLNEFYALLKEEAKIPKRWCYRAARCSGKSSSLLREYTDDVRTNAMKEFWETLKERAATKCYTDKGRAYTYKLVYVDDGDDLLKEMTGDCDG